MVFFTIFPSGYRIPIVYSLENQILVACLTGLFLDLLVVHQRS